MKLFPKITYHNVTNSSNWDLISDDNLLFHKTTFQVICIRFIAKNLDFDHWSTSLLFFSSLCVLGFGDNQNCHMNVVFKWYRYLHKMNSHWNKVLCSYLRRENKEAKGGCCIFINYLGKLIGMMAIVEICLIIKKIFWPFI